MCKQKISLARGIFACCNILNDFARPAALYCKQYVYIHTYLTAQRPCMNFHCYQIILQWNIFTQIENVVKRRLDIYHWGTRLAVTGRIRDIGHMVLQAFFETGSSSIPSCLHGFLLRLSTKPLLEIKFYHALILQMQDSVRSLSWCVRQVQAFLVRQFPHTFYPALGKNVYKFNIHGSVHRSITQYK